MFKTIIAIILIGVSFAGFVIFSNPIYKEISAKKLEISAYDEALNNSKALENERDKLTAKYNAISPENLVKIQKLLPDNIDNIRLILEIEKVALPYGMVLRDVRYNALQEESSEDKTGAVQGGQVDRALNSDYGSWDLEFSITSNYNNFLNFTKDLENNLRIVDISSIQFSSGSESKTNPSLPEVYKFSFKIKTYWLKN